MPAFLCTTCGTQYPESDQPPARCAICEDERQFVNPLGQSWVAPGKLGLAHRNAWTEYEPNLFGVGTVPAFGIGQRALLLRLPGGNILWDCISLIDTATIEIVRALGGLSVIAISHPHYYAAMVDWSHAFGNVPVLLHEADRKWVMRPDPAIRFWSGDTQALAPGVSLIRCGGHFAGATVLHWAEGAAGKGALLSGDVVQVGPDGKAGFMRSYPNYIPLDAGSVRRIGETLARWPFEPIYGAWWDRVIARDGKAVMAESVRRTIAALERSPD